MTATVLFVCIHNSARSQMAEAFLRRYGSERFEAHSAGIEPGTLNPLVVAVMRERGIDISQQTTKSVAAVISSGRSFAQVITVCDEASAERCPRVPGSGQRLHWGFPDPSSFEGSPDERLQRTREVRDAIEDRVRTWCGLPPLHAPPASASP